MSWPLVELKDCCTVTGGATPKRNVDDFWNSKDIAWVTPKDISKLKCSILEDAPEYISQKGFDSCGTHLLPKNSLLLTSRAPIGNVAISGRPMATNQGFKSLIPSKKVDIKYLYYCLIINSEKLQSCGNGATFKEVSKKIVEEFKIPLPPLETQKQIATILEKADQLRKDCQQMENELNSLAQSVFIEMFGDPVSNPKMWDIQKLADLGEIKGGLQVTHKRVVNDIELPYLRVANVYRDKLKLDVIKTIKVTEMEQQRTTLYVGDILFVEGHGNSNEVGRCAVWDGSIKDCVHQNHLIRFRPSTKVLSQYVSSFVNSASGKRQLLQMSKTTSGLNTLSASNISNIKILVPPVEYQFKYIKVIRLLDIQKQTNILLMSSLIDNFNALMQKAFKGELDLK